MVGGPVGKWVRTRTEADAKEFLDEQQARRQKQATWSRRENVLFVAILVVIVLLAVLNGALT